MGNLKESFKPLGSEPVADDFTELNHRSANLTIAPSATAGAVATAKFHGFDLDDQPLITVLMQAPGQILRARTTIALTRDQIGSRVVVLFENGDPCRPIVVGVLQERIQEPKGSARPMQQVSIQADGDRFVVTAEREIVLRCGEASITLTRAGKVIIKGNYVLSRSTGYNKIKGAAVGIN